MNDNVTKDSPLYHRIGDFRIQMKVCVLVIDCKNQETYRLHYLFENAIEKIIKGDYIYMVYKNEAYALAELLRISNKYYNELRTDSFCLLHSDNGEDIVGCSINGYDIKLKYMYKEITNLLEL